MLLKTTYTHKGWFGFCPVYMTGLDDDQAPAIDARQPWMNFLLVAFEYIWGALSLFVFVLGYDLEWPIVQTAELEEPITREYEVVAE